MQQYQSKAEGKVIFLISKFVFNVILSSAAVHSEGSKIPTLHDSVSSLLDLCRLIFKSHKKTKVISCIQPIEELADDLFFCKF